MSNLQIEFGRCKVQYCPASTDSAALEFACNFAKRYGGKQLRGGIGQPVISRILPDPLPKRLGRPQRNVVFILDPIATNTLPPGPIEAILAHIGYTPDEINMHTATKRPLWLWVAPFDYFPSIIPATWEEIFRMTAFNQPQLGHNSHIVRQVLKTQPYHEIMAGDHTFANARRWFEEIVGCNPQFSGTGSIVHTETGRTIPSESLAPNAPTMNPKSVIIYLDP